MALTVIDSPPTNEFLPLVGCGIKFCLEEDAYELAAGEQSFIPIVFNFFSNVTDGDTMLLHGFLFTFVTAAPSNLQEIQINGNLTGINVFNTLSSIPFFIDNYNLTQASDFEVYIQNKVEKIDNNYSFSATTANVDAIVINPFYPSADIQAGADPTYKDDYIVEMDVIDVTAGEVVICQEPFQKPLNLLSDGSTKVCFDIQRIIQDYNKVRSLPPSIFANFITLEDTYVNDFRVRFTSSYAQGGGFDRIIDSSFIFPSALGLRYDVVNMAIDVDSEYDVLDYSYFGAPSLPIEMITVLPSDYGICVNTPFEFRLDIPIDLIVNTFGGNVQYQVTYHYSDGSSVVMVVQNLNTGFDGVHVFTVNFDNLPSPNPAKILVGVSVTVFQTVLAVTELVASNRWNFNTNQGFCCDCNNAFYFLSRLGNNELIISKCVAEQELELEFAEVCKEVACGGEAINGATIYDGGLATFQMTKKQRNEKVLFQCNSPEYLEAFLESPLKYVLEDTKLYRITPTQGSYKIFQINDNKFYLEFSYYKSIQIFSKTLNG